MKGRFFVICLLRCEIFEDSRGPAAQPKAPGVLPGPSPGPVAGTAVCAASNFSFPARSRRERQSFSLVYDTKHVKRKRETIKVCRACPEIPQIFPKFHIQVGFMTREALYGEAISTSDPSIIHSPSPWFISQNPYPG